MDPAMADRTEPHNNLIVLAGVIAAILLFLVTVGLVAFYGQVYQKWLTIGEATPNDDLTALRSREESLLTMYNIDSSTGKVRIPIERAMQLEAGKPWRPNTPWPAPMPTPASTPTSATQEVTQPNASTPHAP